MKNILLIASALLIETNAYTQTNCDITPVTLVNPSPCFGTYELAFEDNFDGDELDLTKWSPFTGVPRDFNFQYQKAWHLPENIEVNSGTCKIIAKKLSTPYTGTWVTDYSTTPPTQATSTFDFTTGEMSSNDAFFYGIYEARCRLPIGKGFWPAFWVFGADNEGAGNEIDFFEIFGNDIDKYTCNVHHEYDNNDVDHQCYYEQDNLYDFSQWHVFTCIYEPNKIIWQIDGTTIRTLYKYYSSTFPWFPIPCPGPGAYGEQKPFPVADMHIVLNLAIQNGPSLPDANTVFPNTFEIDYVRYYRRLEIPCTGCLDHITYENTNQLPALTKTNNFILAGNNSTIMNGQDVTFKAPSIGLVSEFSVTAGAIFNAIPEECNAQNAASIPIDLRTNAINDYEIIKCINPLYTIEATGVMYYSVRISDSWGQDFLVSSGMPTSNYLITWNTVTAAEGWYHVTLILSNCSVYSHREFDVLVSNGACRMSGIDTTNNTYSSTLETSTALFYIYPNPSNDEINVMYATDSSRICTVLIYDMIGQELARHSQPCLLGSNTISIETGELASGTYLLKLVAGDEIKQGVFIISR